MIASFFSTIKKNLIKFIEDKIERLKWEKTLQMSDAFKVITKYYFYPQILQIILGQSPNSFSIQFWYKNNFFIFFVSSLRKERERCQIPTIEKKTSINTDFDHQNDQFYC
jgi:hypothetical protein